MGREKQAEEEKKKSAERVTFALLGYQPGMKVRITDANGTALPGSYQGLVVTILGEPFLHNRSGGMRWYFDEDGTYFKALFPEGRHWCREDCMEPVWDNEKSESKK